MYVSAAIEAKPMGISRYCASGAGCVSHVSGSWQGLLQQYAEMCYVECQMAFLSYHYIGVSI